MKIAVLIPCYNVEHFIADGLDSVLAAGASMIICADDGSTDNTAEILKSYAERYSQVKVFQHPNHGVSYTRNFLLEQLPDSVDAFTFMDADDTIAPDYLSRLEEAMERTNADIVEYAAHLVKKETLVEDPSVFWLKRTNPGIRSAIVGKLISRKACGAVRLRAELSYEEDLMYSYEINAVIRRKVILPGFPYNYRYNPASATQNINWRRYVESACMRIKLFQTEFLGARRVPEALEEEFRRDLVQDAYRMCLRKNLRKNRDAALRHELFDYVSDFFRGKCVLSTKGLGLIQRLTFACCLRKRYLASRILTWF